MALLYMTLYTITPFRLSTSQLYCNIYIINNVLKHTYQNFGVLVQDSMGISNFLNDVINEMSLTHNSFNILQFHLKSSHFLSQICQYIDMQQQLRCTTLSTCFVNCTMFVLHAIDRTNMFHIYPPPILFYSIYFMT